MSGKGQTPEGIELWSQESIRAFGEKEKLQTILNIRSGHRQICGGEEKNLYLKRTRTRVAVSISYNHNHFIMSASQLVRSKIIIIIISTWRFPHFQQSHYPYSHPVDSLDYANCIPCREVIPLLKKDVLV